MKSKNPVTLAEVQASVAVCDAWTRYREAVARQDDAWQTWNTCRARQAESRDACLNSMEDEYFRGRPCSNAEGERLTGAHQLATAKEIEAGEHHGKAFGDAKIAFEHFQRAFEKEKK